MTAPIWATPPPGRPVSRAVNEFEQRGWNGEGSGAISVAFVLDQLRFHYALGEFLDEQRNPVRLVDDLFLDLPRQCFVPNRLGDNSVTLFAAHPIEA